MLPNPFFHVFKKLQHCLLSIVYAFIKVPLKNQIYAYHYFNKTSPE